MLSQNILCPQALIEIAIDANFSQKQWAGEKTRRLQYQVWELFCGVIDKESKKHLRLN